MASRREDKILKKKKKTRVTVIFLDIVSKLIVYTFEYDVWKKIKSNKFQIFNRFGGGGGEKKTVNPIEYFIG